MVVLSGEKFPVEGGALSFDMVRPEGDRPLPLVVFLHGGGWISGDRSMYNDEAMWLAPQGFACACIEYRLAPLHPFPTPVADAQAFIRFAKSNAADLSIDPDQIVVMGNSAGGHLALMLGLCPNRLDSADGLAERVAGVVAVCAISDMTTPAEAHFPIAMSFLEQFMDGPYFGREEVWQRASPAHYVGHAQGKFLLLHGTEDDVVPVDQSRRMAKLLTETGIPTKLVELDGEMHSFTYEGWMRIREEYTAFLKSLS